MEEIEVNDPYGFIYITTNMVNGKRYIGQKKFDGASRWKSYLGSGYYLQKAIKKYGKENFIRSIVDISYSFEELNRKEKQWIDDYNAVENNGYYNRIDGGITNEHLVKRNSIPIMCLNNGMIFNSITDASIWSRCMKLTIKKSFIREYKGNQNKKLIFRPIDELKKCIWCKEPFYSTNKHEKECRKCGKYFRCEDCGLDFERVKQRQVRCEECQEIRTKEKAMLRKKKYKEKQKEVHKMIDL